MLIILKGYILRLYPTDKQKELINKTIGCTRFIYNYFLSDTLNEVLFIKGLVDKHYQEENALLKRVN